MCYLTRAWTSWASKVCLKWRGPREGETHAKRVGVDLEGVGVPNIGFGRKERVTQNLSLAKEIGL